MILKCSVAFCDVLPRKKVPAPAVKKIVTLRLSRQNRSIIRCFQDFGQIVCDRNCALFFIISGALRKSFLAREKKVFLSALRMSFSAR